AEKLDAERNLKLAGDAPAVADAADADDGGDGDDGNEAPDRVNTDEMTVVGSLPAVPTMSPASGSRPAPAPAGHDSERTMVASRDMPAMAPALAALAASEATVMAPPPRAEAAPAAKPGKAR